MRGELFSQPYFHKLASRQFPDSRFIFLACVVIFAAIFSGCASVSAGNSAAEPVAAKISIVPSAIDFKAVVVGQKNSQTVKITNLSVAPINLEHLHVSGMGFALSGAKTPLTLPSGKHADLSIAFAPASASDASGSLVISSSDLKAPISIPLSGSGEKADPALAISPSSVNFGAQAVKSSTPQSVTLKNTGNIALSINSVRLEGPNFSVSGLANGISLSPGQRVEFQVWFHPVVAGKSASTITVAAPALQTPVRLALTGTASPTPATPSTALVHSVTLSWDASASANAGYHIYRSESSSGSFQRITSSVADSLNYKDSSVQAGGRYYYVVTAVEVNGLESVYSNEVSAEIPNP